MSELMDRVGDYLEGRRCEECDHPKDPGAVCQCRRDRAYQANAHDVDTWLAGQLDILADRDDKAARRLRKTIIGSSGAALARSRRRAGYGAIPTGEGTMTLDDDERLGFNLEHDIDAKWRPRRSAWTSRADDEPI